MSDSQRTPSGQDDEHPMVHRLKTWRGIFSEVVEGRKTYEIRKEDRPYEVGDTLVLQEYDQILHRYTGREHHVLVTYKTDGGQWGLPNDICVMGIAPFAPFATAQPMGQPQDDGRIVAPNVDITFAPPKAVLMQEYDAEREAVVESAVAFFNAERDYKAKHPSCVVYGIGEPAGVALREAVERLRAQPTEQESPSLCGAGHRFQGAEPSTGKCRLPHGHDGAHKDDRWGYWTEQEKTSAVEAPGAGGRDTARSGADSSRGNEGAAADAPPIPPPKHCNRCVGWTDGPHEPGCARVALPPSDAPLIAAVRRYIAATENVGPPGIARQAYTEMRALVETTQCAAREEKR